MRRVIMALLTFLLLPLTAPAAAHETPRQAQLATFLCKLRPRLRWGRGRTWNARTCAKAAAALTAESDLHDLLLVAVAIQESDLVDTAVRYDGNSTDGGLMGVRFPSPWTRNVGDVLDLAANIRTGATILRHWRDLSSKTEKHEWWLHYNNGSRASANAFKASYDRRVGAIYTTLCAVFDERPRELRRHTTYAPFDPRTRGLTATILHASAIRLADARGRLTAAAE